MRSNSAPKACRSAQTHRPSSVGRRSPRVQRATARPSRSIHTHTRRVSTPSRHARSTPMSQLFNPTTHSHSKATLHTSPAFRTRFTPSSSSSSLQSRHNLDFQQHLHLLTNIASVLSNQSVASLKRRYTTTLRHSDSSESSSSSSSSDDEDSAPLHVSPHQRTKNTISKKDLIAQNRTLADLESSEWDLLSDGALGIEDTPEGLIKRWSPEELEALPTPFTGNPDIVYPPGFRPLWRQQTYKLDRFGKPLPVDYANHHLHDPYELFDEKTSMVYEPPPKPFDDLEDARRRYVYALATLEEETLNFRQTITDVHELNAFDHVMLPILCPSFYITYVSQDDPNVPYSDRHWFLEARNHPDPDKRYVVSADLHTSWYDMFFYDLRFGPKKLKWHVATAFSVMFGFAGLMTFEGIFAIQDYFAHIPVMMDETHH